MLKRTRIVALALALLLVGSAVAMAAEFNYVVPVAPYWHPWIPRVRVDLQVIYNVPIEQQIIRPWLSVFDLDTPGVYYYERQVVVIKPSGDVSEIFRQTSNVTLQEGTSDGAVVDFFTPNNPIMPGDRIEFTGTFYFLNDPTLRVDFPSIPVLPYPADAGA